jgi:DNA-binding SARP family transcriptional activator/DNA-binding XRE family transcriptional regulator
MELSSFVDELRRQRIQAGLTQRELSRLAGVSVRTIRYLEGGEIRRPREESVRRLAAAVGLAPDTPPGRRGLRISVLGPLTAWRGLGELDLGPAKQRTLLALLALHPGDVVGLDEIIEMLWGERPPATRRELVHAHVSRLRRVLDPRSGGQNSVLRSVRGGYRLVVTGDETDLGRFRRLASAARTEHGHPEAAFALWARAIECWRGPAVVDVADRVRLHPTVSALAHARIAAALAFSDAAFEVRRPDAAVEPLRELARLEPLHEGVHAKLMLALAGSGQQAEALRLHAGIRVRLDEELGVRPGPELLAALRSVLRQEWPESVPRDSPSAHRI